MKNNLLIDYTKLVVGQKLWDILLGEVIFVKLQDGVNLIQCKHLEDKFTYYKNGKFAGYDKYPRLYLSNPFEEVNEFPKLMEVAGIEEKWYQRLVYCYDSEKKLFIAQHNDNPSEICKWNRAREIQEPQIIEYTLEEIANKLSIDPKLLRIKK